MKVLYLATRWPWPESGGRERMISQSLRHLSRLGSVHLLAVGQLGDAPAPAHIASHRTLSAPRLAEIFWNAITSPGLPLQCHIMYSRSSIDELHRAVIDYNPDLLVFDMLRTLPLALGLRRRGISKPFILDMDDRLSVRYERMLRNDNTNLFATFARRVPPIVRAVAARVPTLVLHVEHRLMARAELSVPTVFDGVLLVSAKEAQELNHELGMRLPVQAFPPSVSGVAQTLAAPQTDRFVFLGNEDTVGNSEALLLFDEIAAEVRRRDPAHAYSFEMAGARSKTIVTKHVTRHGFVPDVSAFFERTPVFVAPLRTGTGIKTKVLDAMKHGLPLVSTRLGVEGLSVVEGTHYLGAETLDEFVSLLIRVRSGQIASATLSALAQNAADLVRAEHNDDSIHASLRVLTTKAFDHAQQRSVLRGLER